MFFLITRELIDCVVCGYISCSQFSLLWNTWNL